MSTSPTGHCTGRSLASSAQPSGRIGCRPTLTDIEHADTIVAIAGDLEESHQVVSLRIKDAVTKNDARLILVSPRWSELVRFSDAWLRPTPGHEAQAAQVVATAAGRRRHRRCLRRRPRDRGSGRRRGACRPGGSRLAPRGRSSRRPLLTVRSAPPPKRPPRSTWRSPLAVRTPRSTYTTCRPTPTCSASQMPASRPTRADAPSPEIIQGAGDGSVRALVIHADNPLLNSPGRPEIESALSNPRGPDRDRLAALEHRRACHRRAGRAPLPRRRRHAHLGRSPHHPPATGRRRTPRRAFMTGDHRRIGRGAGERSGQSPARRRDAGDGRGRRELPWLPSLRGARPPSRSGAGAPRLLRHSPPHRSR